jgi:hypothetical protein
MTSFLGMEVEQDTNSIRLHLNNYIQDTLSEYKAAIKKFYYAMAIENAGDHLLVYL